MSDSIRILVICLFVTFPLATGLETYHEVSYTIKEMLRPHQVSIHRLFMIFPGLLGFCVLTVCFSGPGQTYVLAFLLSGVQKEFALSATKLGFYYSMATLLSAFTLPFFARLVDLIPLVRYVVLAVLISSTGFFLLAVNQFESLILAALFLIRVSGQGLFYFAGRTTASREFGAVRGKALAISGLGNLPAEICFPILTAFSIEMFGWRVAALVLGGLILLFYLPLSTSLLIRFGEAEFAKIHARFKKNSFEPRVTYSESKVNRDPRFYFMLFSNVCQPFVLTGIFYFQAQIAEIKGWTMTGIATAFSGYAIARAASAVVVGPIIDRKSARILYPLHLGILFFSLLVLRLGVHPFTAHFFLGLCGLSVGMSGNVILALWVELYGSRNAAYLQGWGSGCAVIATALAPLIYGYCLDLGAPLDKVLELSQVFVIFSALVGWTAIKLPVQRA